MRIRMTVVSSDMLTDVFEQPLMVPITNMEQFIHACNARRVCRVAFVDFGHDQHHRRASVQAHSTANFQIDFNDVVDHGLHVVKRSPACRLWPKYMYYSTFVRCLYDP